MRNFMLDDDDSVARYCGPRTLIDNKPAWTAFQPREDHSFLSVNWVEYFCEPEIADALKKIAENLSTRLTVKKTGRFAVIGVRKISQAGRRNGLSLHVKLQPDIGNESHAGIFGYTIDDKMVAIELAHAVSKQDVFVPRT